MFWPVCATLYHWNRLTKFEKKKQVWNEGSLNSEASTIDILTIRYHQSICGSGHPNSWEHCLLATDRLKIQKKPSM